MPGRSYLYRSLEYSPDYEPNYEFGKKKVSSPGPKFERLSSRKPVYRISASTNDNYLDVDKIYKNEYSVFAEK